MIWEEFDICELMWFGNDYEIIKEKGCYVIYYYNKERF